jgi:hypothetical protein
VRLFNDARPQRHPVGRALPVYADRDRAFTCWHAWPTSISTRCARGIASQAREYPWSSHEHHIGLRYIKLITPPWVVLGRLGTRQEKGEALTYAELVQGGLRTSIKKDLPKPIKGWALGSADFCLI